MKFVRKKFQQFAKKQDGNATIEFVILFPGLMTLFLVGFEAGYYMVRNVSMERAVDIAVRDVRLSNGQIPNLAQFKERICQEAAIFEDCQNLVKVDVEPIAKGAGGIAAVANGPIRCVDRNAANNGNGTGGGNGTGYGGGSGNNTGQGASNGQGNGVQDDIYNVGVENQMMVMRVCLLAEPMFPTTGLGVGMKYDDEGNLAIVATTAFVNEPGNRAVAPTSNCGTGNGVGCGTGYGDGSGNNTGQGATNGEGINGGQDANSGQDQNGSQAPTSGQDGSSAQASNDAGQGTNSGQASTGGQSASNTPSTNSGSTTGTGSGGGGSNGGGTCDTSTGTGCGTSNGGGTTGGNP